MRLEFSKAAYPTITSMAQLEGENGAGLSALTTQRRRELLEDKSGLTEVEKTDGAWPAVERAGGGRLAVADLAKIWESQIAPAEKEPATRKGYFAAWRTVVTFALSHDDVGMVLPMTQDTLKSFTVELLIVGYSVNSIKNIWSAIEDRPRGIGCGAITHHWRTIAFSSGL